MNKNNKIRKKIINMLDKNPLVYPAVSLCFFLLQKYKKKDWEEYEKETGNISPIKTKNEKDFLDFLFWVVCGFEEGLKLTDGVQNE